MVKMNAFALHDEGCPDVNWTAYIIITKVGAATLVPNRRQIIYSHPSDYTPVGI